MSPLPAFACLTLVCLTAAARAAFVSMDFSSAPLEIPNSLDGLYLNVVTGLTTTSSVPVDGWDINPYNRGDGLGFFTPATPSGQGTLASGPTALALVGGEVIGPSGLFQPDQALGTNFQVTGVEYAGFRFLNESNGLINYGWLRLSTTANGTAPGFPAALLGYAYEDSGEPLFAGQIPEPHALALAGLAALMLGRRRNR